MQVVQFVDRLQFDYHLPCNNQIDPQRILKPEAFISKRN